MQCNKKKSKNDLTEIIESIKRHPDNTPEALLELFNWAPSRSGRRVSGNCISGHSSQSGQCAVLYSSGLYCYNCGKFFDSISIVQTIKKGSFHEAVKFLATRAKIDFSNVALNSQHSKIVDVLEHATEYYNHHLLNDEYLLNIVHKRYGLDLDGVKRFKIGLSSYKGNLRQHLSNAGFNEEILSQTGLFNHYDKNEFFDGRIIIPYQRDGRTVYMIGRKTPNVPPKSSTPPKYMKLSVQHADNDMGMFIDNSAIFGEDSLHMSDTVVIAEGVFDCISVLLLGHASISPVTTQFSSLQFERLEHLLKNKEVIVTGDNEFNRAGEIGAHATCEKLLKLGINVFYASVPSIESSLRPQYDMPTEFKWPDGKTDLNDIINVYGKEGFTKVLEGKKIYQEIWIDKNINEIRRNPENIIKLFDPIRSKSDSANVKSLSLIAGRLSDSVKIRADILKNLIAEYYQSKASQAEKYIETALEVGLDDKLVINSNRPHKAIAEDFEKRLAKKDDFFVFGENPVIISNHKTQALTDSESLGQYVSRHVCESVTLIADSKGKIWTTYHSLPKNLSSSLIKTPSLFTSIKKVDFIYSHPFLKSDYSFSDEGFDPQLRAFCLKSGIEPRSDLNYLLDLLYQWPWSDRASMTNYLAILLTGFCRHFFPGSFAAALISGTGPGKGKGTLCSLYSSLFEDGLSNIIVYNRQEDELRKAIVSLLLGGVNSIVYDNIREAEFCSSLIESMLTQDEIVLRILGGNTNLRRKNIYQQFFTLNDSMLSPDLIDRCVPIFLGRDEWVWKNPNFFEDFKTNRERTLSALMGMFGTWRAKGCPEANVKHRFTKWGRLIGGVLEANGVGHFLENVDFARQMKNSDNHEMIDLLSRLHFNKGYTSKELVNMVPQNSKLEKKLGFGEIRSKSIRLAKELKKYSGKPLNTDAGTIQLSTEMNSALNSYVYKLERLESQTDFNL